jgi:hypothetical protein
VTGWISRESRWGQLFNGLLPKSTRSGAIIAYEWP